MDPSRLKRQEEIKQALLFIQSTLAYPNPDGYQDFLTKLVCNLLDEGNTFFRDNQWELAIREFSEGLNVSCYAEAGEVHIPKALLESLYVNRAAAYHSMGDFQQGVSDCNSALGVCNESHRALYRKALCLKELGKFREAYECITNCLLVAPLDEQVNELAQQLSVHLGLKCRIPYVSSKAPPRYVGNGFNHVQSISPVSNPSLQQSSLSPPSSSPSLAQPAVPAPPARLEPLEDLEVMGDDLDSLLDCFSSEQQPTEVPFSYPPTFTHSAPSELPAPTPKLPPTFFSSAVSQLNALDVFSSDDPGASGATLDILDDLSTPANTSNGSGAAPAPSSALDALDNLDTLDSFNDFVNVKPNAAAVEAQEPKTELDAKSLDKLLEVNSLKTNPVSNGLSGAIPKKHRKSVHHLDSLDALDSFSSEQSADGPLPAVSMMGPGLDSISNISSVGITNSHNSATRGMRFLQNHNKEKDNQGPSAVSNPLFTTHEFLQACSTCYPREGRSIYSYVHKPNLAHKCKRDILLCRWKSSSPLEWTRVRPLPSGITLTAPFELCREVQNSGVLGLCKYGEKCTFAYNQLEIEIWTEERKGLLDRNLLFETTAAKLDPIINVVRLLQENKGAFMFLCQECYDNKPRIISKRSTNNRTVCSNTDVHHNFDANKCLAFVVQSHNVVYKKVRPLSIMCQLDLCRQAIRYGCQREDACHYAHSVIELKTWRVQRDTGVSFDEIVKVSEGFYEKQEQNLFSGASENKPKEATAAGGGGKNLDLKMKFVCAFCWRDGLISEPDKSLKYCSSKSRHAWTKDRRVLLVKSVERSKWIQVRPLPHQKNFPSRYEICNQILKKKKCTFSGPCTFAHSQEEKDIWMYMKRNELYDMQQMYDMWLSLTMQNHQVQESQPTMEDKFIDMPTDHAELLSSFHCHLCGKHSNSDRQWQQHISSEKHKDKVFSCEDEEEALMWSYRFPGTQFQLCSKVDDVCPDGVSCDFAHSKEELQEWTERRLFLRRKLAKAREDMLIMPNEFDFGKFNFLLQD